MDYGSVQFEVGELVQIPRHAHDNLELFFLLKGQVLFDLDGKQYELSEQDVITCNQNQVYGAQGMGSNVALRLSFGRDFLLQETGTDHMYLCCNSSKHEAIQNLSAYKEIRYHLRTLLHIRCQQEASSKLETKSVLLQLLSVLYERFQDIKHQPDRPDMDIRVAHVVEEISSHYRDDISLQTIANRMHTSVYYLSRLFKQETGKNFTEYLHQVRLDSAVNELLQSQESILKIAMGNGFSSVSGFNRCFRQAYGDTPFKYRAARRLSKYQDRGGQLVELTEDNDSLIKYLRQFETRRTATPQSIISHKIQLQTSEQQPMPELEKIICVGHIHQILKLDVREQLNTLHWELMPITIHAACVFNDGIYPYQHETYGLYEHYQCFDFLQEMNFVPFLQLRLSEQQASLRSPQAMAAQLTDFLSAMYKRYPASYLSQWRFELYYPAQYSLAEVYPYYMALRRATAEWLSDSKFSLSFHCDTETLQQRAAAFAELLDRISSSPPSHITFYLQSLPNERFNQQEDYLLFQHIVSRLMGQFNRIMGQNGHSDLRLELMQWSTLSGFTTLAANTFYRSGIFMDEILHLPQNTISYAVWLNTYIQESATGQVAFHAISLFFVSQLKRPVYYALSLLHLLYPTALYRQENVIVTQNTNRELAILIMNPCYFNPNLADDTEHTIQYQQSTALRLIGLEGLWTVEYYHMDNRKTSIYERWAGMGFPNMLNPNVIRQLIQNVHFKYAVYEKSIAGAYDISVLLEFNEAMVILLHSNTPIQLL